MSESDSGPAGNGECHSPGMEHFLPRAGAAFASRKAQLVNEMGAGALHPGLWRRRTLPLSPWAALQAGQYRAALPGFSLARCREFVLPLAYSANKAITNSEPEKELCPKV